MMRGKNLVGGKDPHNGKICLLLEAHSAPRPQLQFLLLHDRLFIFPCKTQSSSMKWTLLNVLQ